LISAQHIEGYIASDNFSPGLITRYINVSIILILFFAFTFFFKYKKFELNKKTTIISSILLILLFFFQYKGIKFTLNSDLSALLKSNEEYYLKDLVEPKLFLKVYFIPFVFILLAMLVMQKRKLLIAAFGIYLASLSLLTIIWASDYSGTSAIADFFDDKETEISLALENNDIGPLKNMWRILATTKSKVNLIVIGKDPNRPPDFILTKEALKNSNYFNQSEFIISSFNTDLPLAMETTGPNIYYNPDFTPNE
jgi:glucan phosphoethanolaminetransferase (alkaline phosphatase superfamily)